MNLSHLGVFRAVAEHRSFTRAAAQLGADKAHVSRVVRALERELGVVLFARSTRAVALTAAGEGLLAGVRAPLDALQAAGSAVVARSTTPSGVVSLTTTSDLARALVAPLWPSLRARYPQLALRIHVDDALRSFADPALDLALRVGPLRRAEARTRKLGELHAGFFAAPRYLAARGTPTALADLRDHDTAWPHGSKRLAFAMRAAPAPSVACDDFAVGLELARAGGGVAVLPLHLAVASVLQGALVRVLGDTTLPGAPLSLLTRSERPLPARVAAVQRHLVEHVPLLLA